MTLYPIQKATTHICLSKLTSHYFVKIGKPSKILSDHGSQFTSPVWRTSLEALGLRVLFSSIRHPQSNPVERTMHEIGRILRTYCSDKHASWGKHVAFVQDCLNYTVHQSTVYTTYTLHFGKEPREKIIELFPRLRTIPLSHDLKLIRANQNMQKAFERRCKTQKNVSQIKLSIGDLVLLRIPHLSDAIQKQICKFFHIYEGPFRIVGQTGGNAFKLVDCDDSTKVKGIYNRLNTRKYYEPLTIVP